MQMLKHDAFYADSLLDAKDYMEKADLVCEGVKEKIKASEEKMNNELQSIMHKHCRDAHAFSLGTTCIHDYVSPKFTKKQTYASPKCVRDSDDELVELINMPEDVQGLL